MLRRFATRLSARPDPSAGAMLARIGVMSLLVIAAGILVTVFLGPAGAQAGSADLSVSKTGPATAVAGGADGFDYTITVTNNGPDDNTDGYTVTDLLPKGVHYQTSGLGDPCSAVANQGPDTDQDLVTCSAAGLSATSPGNTHDFTLHVKVDSSVLDGTTVDNSATVNGGT